MNTPKLIELVRQREEIYNIKHPNHRNRDLIAAIWKDIAAQLKTSDAEAKTKWQILRSNFMRERRKLRASTSGSEPDGGHVSWQFFPLMSFLDDRFCMRKTRIKNLDQSENMVKIDNSEDIKLEGGRTNNNYCATSEPIECCDTSLFVDTHISPGYSSTGSQPTVKRRIVKTQPLNNDEDMDRRYLDYDELSSPVDNNDPDLLFFKSLLPQIKKLNLNDNLSFKVEVAQLLLRKLQSTVTISPPGVSFQSSTFGEPSGTRSGN